MNKVTVVINNCNLLTWPKAMVEKIQQFAGLENILIVDNKSTYEPLLQWYKDSKLNVHFLSKNVGHTAPWLPEVLAQIKTDWYVITDPDLDLSAVPNDTLLHLQHCLVEYPKALKIGLSLRIDDLPKASPMYRHCHLGDEGWYWSRPVIGGLIRGASVDTTFAIYHKKILNTYKLFGARSIPPYVARHLPWYITDKPDEEFQYYLDHATRSSTYKTHMGQYVRHESVSNFVSPFKPYRIIEHIPEYAKHLESEKGDFKTEDELRTIPFIAGKTWFRAGEAEFLYGPFLQANTSGAGYLIAKQSNGDHWIVGTLNKQPPWLTKRVLVPFSQEYHRPQQQDFSI